MLTFHLSFHVVSIKRLDFLLFHFEELCFQPNTVVILSASTRPSMEISMCTWAGVNLVNRIKCLSLPVIIGSSNGSTLGMNSSCRSTNARFMKPSCRISELIAWKKKQILCLACTLRLFQVVILELEKSSSTTVITSLWALGREMERNQSCVHSWITKSRGVKTSFTLSCRTEETLILLQWSTWWTRVIQNSIGGSYSVNSALLLGNTISYAFVYNIPVAVSFSACYNSSRYKLKAEFFKTNIVANLTINEIQLLSDYSRVLDCPEEKRHGWE